MTPSCHTLSKALNISVNSLSHLWVCYNQKMHKYEQLEVLGTHMNQKVENQIGYHKEDSSLEGIQNGIK